MEIIGQWLYFTSFDTIYRKSSHDSEIERLGTLGDSVTVSKLFDAKSRLIAGTYGNGVFESPDSGFTWVQRNSGLTGVGAQSVSCIASRGDSLYIGTSGAGIFVTPTAGPISWQHFSEGLPWNLAWDVYSLYEWNNMLFSGAGQNGYIYRNLHDSSAWNHCQFNENIGTGLAMLSFYSLGPELLIGIGFNGIYNSTDSGATWQYSPAPFNAAASGKVIVNGELTLALLSHPTLGLYMFEWNNNTWQLWDHQTGLIAYDFEYFDGCIYASCWDGLWYYQLLPTGVDPHDPILPDRPQLSQNYPNPFNPVTTIEYVLPQRQSVTIAIYNVLGQKIRILVDREEAAGRHVIAWDGKTATGEPAAGSVYLYSIRTEDYFDSKKLMLLK
ncbi:MAG: T9SS type A sorting domain-containing protein [Candidatus Zixiibacteriota bacterium]